FCRGAMDIGGGGRGTLAAEAVAWSWASPRPQVRGRNGRENTITRESIPTMSTAGGAGPSESRWPRCSLLRRAYPLTGGVVSAAGPRAQCGCCCAGGCNECQAWRATSPERGENPWQYVGWAAWHWSCCW